MPSWERLRGCRVVALHGGRVSANVCVSWSSLRTSMHAKWLKRVY